MRRRALVAFECASVESDLGDVRMLNWKHLIVSLTVEEHEIPQSVYRCEYGVCCASYDFAFYSSLDLHCYEATFGAFGFRWCPSILVP